MIQSSNQTMKPTAPLRVERVCHDTLPWVVSCSLGIVVRHEKD
jgi:hypothetical protein